MKSTLNPWIIDSLRNKHETLPSISLFLIFHRTSKTSQIVKALLNLIKTKLFKQTRNFCTRVSSPKLQSTSSCVVLSTEPTITDVSRKLPSRIRAPPTACHRLLLLIFRPAAPPFLNSIFKS